MSGLSNSRRSIIMFNDNCVLPKLRCRYKEKPIWKPRVFISVKQYIFLKNNPDGSGGFNVTLSLTSQKYK